MTSKSKGRNLAAASKRRGAEPQRSWMAIRQDLMSGKHRLAPAEAKPAAARKLPASLPATLPYGVPALPEAVERERTRIAGLHSAAAQAARMGLGFDLPAAIASGVSVQAVRAALVNDAAARSDAVGEVATFASQSPFGTGGHGGMSAERKRAAFTKVLRTNAAGGIRPDDHAPHSPTAPR